MDENQDSIKIAYAKNLNRLNFNSTVNMNIDANANIKTILDVDSYIYDEKVECGSSKAIISGKLGVKVLYIDTDNMTNSVSDSVSFSETILDEAITADAIVKLSECNILNNVLDSSASLKINCDVSLNPIVYQNVGLASNGSNFESMIQKKSEINTFSILANVNSNFEYTINLETKDTISKILSYDAYFSHDAISMTDEGAIVDGKMYCKLIYEMNDEEGSKIKEISDSFKLKSEVNISGVNRDCVTELNFDIDKSRTNINTEFEEGNSIVTVTHTIRCNGVALKPISIDVIDDMYSTENELELSTSKRDYFNALNCEHIDSSISGEVTLEASEPAIDELISNCNIVGEITNKYLKDGELIVEGIISSHLIYVDEYKECRHKHLELPFVINTKIRLDKIDCLHTSISIVDSKTKVRRGTVIELDYTVQICVNRYSSDSHMMIDNFTLKNPLDYSMYDYQIFLAKPNETMWELCKRIRISPDEISKYNKDLPQVMQGGEKVVIKR